MAIVNLRLFYRKLRQNQTLTTMTVHVILRSIRVFNANKTPTNKEKKLAKCQHYKDGIHEHMLNCENNKPKRNLHRYRYPGQFSREFFKLEIIYNLYLNDRYKCYLYHCCTDNTHITKMNAADTFFNEIHYTFARMC